jgi:hypothetical protein
VIVNGMPILHNQESQLLTTRSVASYIGAMELELEHMVIDLFQVLVFF